MSDTFVRGYPHGIISKYSYGKINFAEAYELLHNEGYDGFTIWKLLTEGLPK